MSGISFGGTTSAPSRGSRPLEVYGFGNPYICRTLRCKWRCGASPALHNCSLSGDKAPRFPSSGASSNPSDNPRSPLLSRTLSSDAPT